VAELGGWRPTRRPFADDSFDVVMSLSVYMLHRQAAADS
jgi:hypothetical protein